MITISELSPAVKNRVIQLFDNDVLSGVFDPQTMRTVVTGLALQTISKKYGVGDGLVENAYPLLTPEQRNELVAERDQNFDSYVRLAIDIYQDFALAELKKEVQQALNAKPISDTTEPGYDSGRHSRPGDACPHCGEDH